jgi:phosphoglycolate phosphatase
VFTPKAVLFDLDGTLADTAADLGSALNAMRFARGLAALPLATLRPHASTGARGLIGVGFARAPGDAEFETLREEFLHRYETALCVDTRLFDGIGAVLEYLEQRGTPWGVVTNKITRFTLPLLAQLGLQSRARTVVCGDTCARAKPYPDQLQHACFQLGIGTAEAVYIGDDLRDVQAGQACGMPTIAAAYGYLGTGDPPQDWGANAIAHSPHDLHHLV